MSDDAFVRAQRCTRLLDCATRHSFSHLGLCRALGIRRNTIDDQSIPVLNQRRLSSSHRSFAAKPIGLAQIRANLVTAESTVSKTQRSQPAQDG